MQNNQEELSEDQIFRIGTREFFDKKYSIDNLLISPSKWNPVLIHCYYLLKDMHKMMKESRNVKDS